MKKLIATVILMIALVLPQTAFGWNATGHKLVASIAWDNLSEQARSNIVNLLSQAPKGDCLRELFASSGGSLADRQREFFVLAATWPDIIRGGKDVPKKCTQLHRPEWHFKDRFWSGFSGDTVNPPKDLNRPLAKINAVERLDKFRPFVAGSGNAGTRAEDLAWILHLVGDIHQPLHTSGRVTSTEQNGDVGGNSFKLGSGKKPLQLHSYWDNIVDRHDPRGKNEDPASYVQRLTRDVQNAFPKSHFGNLEPGQFDKWALESLEKAQQNAYPRGLKRGQLPNGAYETKTFNLAEESIALAGYRLADLLETLFGLH